MSETGDNSDHPPRGPYVRDMIGLVVGYGLATSLVRRYLDDFQAVTVWRGFFLAVAFVWLGLAMSGPLVLLLHRRPPMPHDDVPTTNPRGRFSNAEIAWILLGSYFMLITVLFVPASRGESLWANLVLIHLLASAILLVWLPWRVRKSERGGNHAVRWTNVAAKWVVAAWPLAWIAMTLAAD